MAHKQASHFATAIASFYADNNTLENLKVQNQAFSQLFVDEKKLLAIFADLTLVKEEKIVILKELFSFVELDKNYQNGLILFIQHNYGAHLSDLFSEIRSLCLKLLNQKIVKVYTPSELLEEQKVRLETILKAQYTNKLIFEYWIDPEMVLGIQIKIDDELIDYSLKTQLKTLKDKVAKLS